MKKYYIYNGIPVKFDGNARKKDKFLADNDHLIGKECTKSEYEDALASVVEPPTPEEVNRALWSLLDTLTSEHPGAFKQEDLDTLSKMKEITDAN